MSFMNSPIQDEAIAAVMAEAQPGDIITIHHASCASITAVMHADPELLCTCTPLELVMGAQA